MTQVDPLDPSNITISLSPFSDQMVTFEEMVEGVIKSQALQNPQDPTLQMIYNTVGQAVKACRYRGI